MCVSVVIYPLRANDTEEKSPIEQGLLIDSDLRRIEFSFSEQGAVEVLRKVQTKVQG